MVVFCCLSCQVGVVIGCVCVGCGCEKSMMMIIVVLIMMWGSYMFRVLFVNLKIYGDSVRNRLVMMLNIRWMGIGMKLKGFYLYFVNRLQMISLILSMIGMMMVVLLMFVKLNSQGVVIRVMFMMQLRILWILVGMKCMIFFCVVLWNVIYYLFVVFF